MRTDIFPQLGEAIRMERRRRGLSQADLAARIGRATPRISEFERDLKTSRFGKDRLTLLAEICDALDLVLVLTPRGQAGQASPGPRTQAPNAVGRQPSVFDEVFVDLGDDEDQPHG